MSKVRKHISSSVFDLLRALDCRDVIVDCSASSSLGILIHDSPIQLVVDMHFCDGCGSNILYGSVSLSLTMNKDPETQTVK
jgi:hypothetical protein